MNIEEARKLPLGYQWDPLDLRETYAYRFGGIAWPGKDQGFGVVIGVLEKRQRSGQPWREFHVLAECESWSHKTLLLKCLDLHWRYAVAGWVTNRADAGGDAATQELREKNGAAYDFQHTPATFWTEHPEAAPYAYLVNGLIEELVAGGDKRLYLKNDKAAEQLHALRKDEIPLLAAGTYPAIEALGFALIEARDGYNSIPRNWDDPAEGADDIDPEEDVAAFAWANQPGT